MDRMKKTQIKRTVSLVCAAAVVAVLAAMPLLAESSGDDDSHKASILSGTAAQAEIGTAVKGGGTLAEEEPVEVTVPYGVMLTEFLVSNGDTVAEGDALVSVDRVSVMDAITQVQQTLDDLAKEIEDARDQAVSASVTAQAGGRVKAVYAQAGDSVQDVMLEYGALAVLSLDGLMAVELESNADVAAGDTVTVAFEDGTEVAGLVESALDGKVVVTLDDAGYTVGEKVQVRTEDRRLGSGELYIHNAWRATAYSGTVSKIHVTEETTVSAGKALMTLTDTEYTAEFETLSSLRRDYEAVMLALFRLYQSTTVTAPSGGVVSGVDEDSAYLLSDTGTGWFLSLLSNAPNGDDETIYNNYLAQVSAVDESGWTLILNPENLAVTDYQDLSEISMETDAMTEQVVYSGSAPVYEFIEGQWQQIEPETIGTGDILLFAGDDEGNVVWIIRAAKAGTEEEPDEPTEPPVEPTRPSTDPAESGESGGRPSQPTGETAQSGAQAPQSGRSDGVSGFGGAAQEETVVRYSLEKNPILSVTPQEAMTLCIQVDEQDIAKIALGQTALIKLDALRGETFTGYVTQIGTSGESSGGSGKFTVELTLPRSENMLSGMNATASIAMDDTRTALCIPVAALNEDGSKTYVYTSLNADSGELGNPVYVETGISDGENVQILSGLEDGQTYYYAYYDTLELSTKVESSGFSFHFGK